MSGTTWGAFFIGFGIAGLIYGVIFPLAERKAKEQHLAPEMKHISAASSDYLGVKPSPFPGKFKAKEQA